MKSRLNDQAKNLGRKQAEGGFLPEQDENQEERERDAQRVKGGVK